MAALTALLRFLPFLVFSGKRKTPAVIERFGNILPYSIMGMLVVYCLKNVRFDSPAGFVPALAGTAVTVLSYVWKKNTLVSIVGGTAVYMLLVQTVFG